MLVERKFSNGKLIQHRVNGIDQPIDRITRAIQSREWPLWVKALKEFATPSDKGIGDVVARIIGAETSEKFKAWHIVTFGRPCGCNGRQARWNKQYPLNLL